MNRLVQDLTFAARTLGKSPGFTAVALATLALGIGANTAIFSVVNAVLLRPPPFPEPERVVAVFQTQPSEGIFTNGVSYLNYTDWVSRTHSFEELGALRMHSYTLTGHGEPSIEDAGSVTSNLFSLLHVKPMLGRALTKEDDAPGSPLVVVLGESLWRSRFGGDAAIVGKTILLDARPCEVVGVLPAAFKTPPENTPAALWVPLAQDPVFGDLQKRRAGHYLRLVGRLAPGVSIDRAQAELETVAGSLARQYPVENQGWGVRIVTLAEASVAGVKTALLVLLAAVGLVFLISCANVANLLLARSGARSREVAIRTALGAGRGRLLRQFLTESLLLGLAGGALGLALAAASLGALRGWLPADLPRAAEVRLDAPVLLFSFLASVSSAVIFGLAPALEASGANLTDALREGSLSAGESGGKRRLRSLLVIGETAFSFVLLVGASLLARSFLRLQEVSLGFDPSHVVTAGFSLPRSQYPKPEQWLTFYRELVDRLKPKPGVEGASASLPLPLYGGGLHFAFQVEGRPQDKAESDYSANYTALTEDYFRVLRVSLLQGRLLAESDAADAPKVCVVSSAFAKRFFPGESAVGRRLIFGFTHSVPREIVGVVADVKRNGLGLPSQPEMYVPFAQDPWWAAYVAIRARGDTASIGAVIRREVRALNPDLPIADIQPMTQIVYDSVALPRFRTTLLGLFGLTALLLAVIGIYGVISYSVALRTREVGIRIALGAGWGDVMRLILGQGLALTGIGLAAGLGGAILLTRFLKSLLFDVSPIDPLTYAGVALLLQGAALLACFLPARRAVRIDPSQALRCE
jgi:predicted permease